MFDKLSTWLCCTLKCVCLCMCTHTCVFMWKLEDHFRCCFPIAVRLVDLEVTSRQSRQTREPHASACLHLHQGYKHMCHHAWLTWQVFWRLDSALCAPKASTLSNESPRQPLLFKFLEPPIWWNQITDIISQRNYKIKGDQRDFYSHFNGTMRGMRRAVG